MRQDNIQSKLENQHFVNLIGIIILPNNPFFIKDQPFYLKKLCGVSILERNINIFEYKQYNIKIKGGMFD